jgi:transaldolase
MQTDGRTASRVQAFVKDRAVAEKPVAAAADPFWAGLRGVGTELWLDTGDLDAAAELWCAEFTALTTNNTLLNNEIQKGIYDDLIAAAAGGLSDLEERTRIVEIAFVLNAHHGLRLAGRFKARVSVELHTDLAHDVAATVTYARRYHRIAPERFIIKVPLTPAGLIATRQLRQEGIPVNFTLGFSARHNYLAAAFARPSYVNVFLGRLNAYVETHGLGDGRLVGEKATLASQRVLAEAAAEAPEPVRQIAASMRAGPQVADLAGVDVFTMPAKVAAAARKDLAGTWRSRRDEDYEPGIDADAKALRAGTLWDVGDAVKALARSLRDDPPAQGGTLVDRAHEAGAGDLFPRLSPKDLAKLAAEGKIPNHPDWADRIRAGELAIDTLLNLAGLAAFAADQKALDDRIRAMF